jgi:hypothetical protein
MVYNLRKRKLPEEMEDSETGGSLYKRPRYVLQKMKQFKPVRKKQTSERVSSRKLPSEIYQKQIRDASLRGPRLESNFQEITGSEVSQMSELKSSDNYLKLKVGSDSNVLFILRKGQNLNSNSLRIQETEYSLRLLVANEGVKHLTLQGFMGTLWDVFEKLFDHCVENHEGEEICLHATHDDLDGSLSSSIFQLSPENRDVCISEIMSRISAWNESSRIGAAIKDIRLSVTILKRNLPGDGILLAIGDNSLRKKAFSKDNYNGSILYVDSTSNCFYISIYFCLVYNIYLERFKTATSSEEKKCLHSLLYKVFEKKGEELER